MLCRTWGRIFLCVGYVSPVVLSIRGFNRLQHNDFVDRCRKLCQECGIGFRYSTEITSLSLSDVGDPILHTQSGETIHSDVVSHSSFSRHAA